MKLKNHVSPNAKRISGVLKTKFGFDIALVNKALQGDTTALQTIGEAARQGQQALELMPLIREACLTIEKGTEEYNKSIADITAQGATSAIAIDRATMKAMLANQKYINQRKEMTTEYVLASQAETTRHNLSERYMKLKAYIDMYLQKVDGNAKLVDQANRPEVKQHDETLRYNSAAARHLLQYGEQSRLDLLPQRNYAQETIGGSKTNSILGTLRNIKMSLGF